MLDLQVIADLNALGEDGSVMRSLVELFSRDGADRVARLARTAERGEVDEVRKLAHGLYGSAATLGALRLSALVREVELAAAAGDLPTSARLLEIDEAFLESCLALREAAVE